MAVHISESWDSTTRRVDAPLLRRGRGGCVFCGSSTGFSADDNRGVFYCFACGERGDKLSYVMKALGCDFKAALRFFGLEPGRPPAPDPVAEKKRRARAGLQVWAKRRGRELREEYYNRSRIELCARRRPEKDIDDPIGWGLLEVAYDGLPLDELERLHDLLIGRPWEQLEAYRALEGVVE